MLFLFKGETKGAAPLPPEQFMELAVKQVETSMPPVGYQVKGNLPGLSDLWIPV